MYALCPKTFSTSPGTLVYDFSRGDCAGKPEVFEQSQCSTGSPVKRGVKLSARHKGSAMNHGGREVLEKAADEVKIVRICSCWLIALPLALSSGNLAAEADGPDYYRVRDVASDDVLNIRVEPHAGAAVVGTIPFDGICIRNLGCLGGLDFRDFTTLSKEEQAGKLREHPRWCRIRYRGTEGWVAGRYLAEGNCIPGHPG